MDNSFIKKSPPDEVISTIVKKPSRTVKRLWRDRYIYLMVLPVVIYFIIFKYWPMGFLSISFFDYKLLKGFSGSKFIGFSYFIEFFNSIDFWDLIYNTVIINIYALIFVFPAPIIFALLLNELYNKKFKRLIQTISYLPHFISMVVLTSMIITFLSPTVGTLNMLLKAMGIQPIYFLGSPSYFRAILVVSGIWQGMGWSAIVYLSALSGIEQEMYEAAIVDGAGRFKQIWHITLPGIKTTIVILLILQIGNLMNINFEKVYLLQNPLNLSVSEVIQTYVYKVGIGRAKFGYATAIGLFNSVISLILVAISNRISSRQTEVSLW